MAQYRKKPVVIEAITFDEFVEYGKQAEGTNIVNGMPWAFNYKGHNVTHENDNLYFIPTLEGIHNFTPQDMLITGVNGEIYPCKIDIFEKTYDIANLTYKDGFVNAYENSTKSKMVVAVKLPTGIELIVNTDNLDGKMEYYKNAYNDDMKLKANESIEIINYMFV